MNVELAATEKIGYVKLVELQATLPPRTEQDWFDWEKPLSRLARKDSALETYCSMFWQFETQSLLFEIPAATDCIVVNADR